MAKKASVFSTNFCYMKSGGDHGQIRGFLET